MRYTHFNRQKMRLNFMSLLYNTIIYPESKMYFYDV